MFFVYISTVFTRKVRIYCMCAWERVWRMAWINYEIIDGARFFWPVGASRDT